MTATRWMARAACRGTDPAMWVPDEHDRPDISTLRAICATCPVHDDCMQYALKVVPTTDNGVYAGLTQSQRRRLVRAAGRPRVASCGTMSGYRRHHRLGQSPCVECAEAARLRQRSRSRAA